MSDQYESSVYAGDSFIQEVDYCMSLSKPESLKNYHQFDKVYKEGCSYANRYLVMYVLPNGSETNRLGISVSKKVGNSVVRHRLTRLIRESYRLNQTMLAQGLDIVIIARVGANGRGYAEIESAFRHLCRLHHVIRKEVVG